MLFCFAIRFSATLSANASISLIMKRQKKKKSRGGFAMPRVSHALGHNSQLRKASSWGSVLCASKNERKPLTSVANGCFYRQLSCLKRGIVTCILASESSGATGSKEKAFMYHEIPQYNRHVQHKDKTKIIMQALDQCN